MRPVAPRVRCCQSCGPCTEFGSRSDLARRFIRFRRSRARRVASRLEAERDPTQLVRLFGPGKRFVGGERGERTSVKLLLREDACEHSANVGGRSLVIRDRGDPLEAHLFGVRADRRTGFEIGDLRYDVTPITVGLRVESHGQPAGGEQRSNPARVQPFLFRDRRQLRGDPPTQAVTLAAGEGAYLFLLGPASRALASICSRAARVQHWTLFARAKRSSAWP
jgi:hypothetical protein